MTDNATAPLSDEAIDPSVDLGGCILANPVVLLSGCVGFGEELTRLQGVDVSSIGAICLKGTTLEPRRGNRPDRLAETPHGLLNAIGLQNPGARRVVEEILPRIESLPTRLIANIAGSTVEEYGHVAEIFDDSPVAAIEINISCPNVKEGGAAFGSNPTIAAAVVRTVRAVTKKPIITKLSPNVTDIGAVARAVVEAGTDAISAINTLMGMMIDVQTRRPQLGNVQGGLSGPAILPVALLKVWQVYQQTRAHGIPIIGQGGIRNTEDALAFFIAGASAVGIGTSLFNNPFIGGDIARELNDALRQRGLRRFDQLTGTLQIP